MNGESGNSKQGALWAALLAVALLNTIPRTAGAEEPPPDQAATEGAEAAAEEAPPEGEGQETIDALVTAPGGVPAEPTDADAAVDSVKASMARVEEHEAAGIGSTYTSSSLATPSIGCAWCRASGSRAR
jgi:hypothetical protein